MPEQPTSTAAASLLRGGCRVLTWMSLAPLGASFPIWKMRSWPKQQPGTGAQSPMPLEHTGRHPGTKVGRWGHAKSCQVPLSTPHPHPHPPPCSGRLPTGLSMELQENTEEGLRSISAPHLASSQTLCRVRTGPQFSVIQRACRGVSPGLSWALWECALAEDGLAHLACSC